MAFTVMICIIQICIHIFVLMQQQISLSSFKDHYNYSSNLENKSWSGHIFKSKICIPIPVQPYAFKYT